MLAGALSIVGVNLASAQDNVSRRAARLRLQLLSGGLGFRQRRLLSINSNQALFALLGTSFGGNGTTTFGLPNLNGRAPYGTGQGPRLPNYVLGERFGVSAVTLQVQNLPPHTHQLHGSTANLGVASPANAIAGTDPNSAGKFYAPAGSQANAPMAPNAIGITGNGFPVNTQSPGLAVTWCIATTGIFPSRP
jgi:microcystin-dependent protein